MKKVLKKMKLNELQKVDLCSKEMQRITGGVCGCVGTCLGSNVEDSVMIGLTIGKSGCGY